VVDANCVDDPVGGCEAATVRLAAEIYERPQGCAIIVRLDHESLRILSYQLVCGRYTGVAEEDARATAREDTGYGDGRALHPDDPEGAFVFYSAPGDFGGVGVVSEDTGLSVFGGSIVWNGRGDIVWPSAWREGNELGNRCGPEGRPPTTYSYDLVEGGEIQDARLSEVLEITRDTAIDQAFWRGGYVFDVVVLRYPRSVGVFNPATAEYIVIFNGGWLE
jgi:hypothetical protein